MAIVLVHRRSLVETPMFRQKTIVSSTLCGRKPRNQQVEAAIMANILNKMTALGMPKSVMDLPPKNNLYLDEYSMVLTG